MSAQQQPPKVTSEIGSIRAAGNIAPIEAAYYTLTDRDGRLSRVLGVLETLGPVGRAPRRFRTTAPMQAEAASAPRVPRPAPGQRPALRLISGGRA